MSMITLFGVETTNVRYNGDNPGGFTDNGVPVVKFSNAERTTEVSIHVDSFGSDRRRAVRELRKLAYAFLQAANRVEEIADEADADAKAQAEDEDEDEDVWNPQWPDNLHWANR